MWKRLLPILLLVITSILFCGVLFEVILRHGLIENPQYFRYYNRKQVSSNPKHKLLIVGDSFVRPHSLLHTTLSDDLGARDIMTYNVANGGTGPYEYLKALNYAVSEFRPDIIVVFYYVGNDLYDVQRHPPFSPEVLRDKSILQSIIEKFYMYHYFEIKKRVIYGRWIAYRQLEDQGLSPEVVELAKQLQVNPHLADGGLRKPDFLLFNVLMESKASMGTWERTKGLLGEMNRIAIAIDAQLAIVIIPHTIQVDRSHFEFFQSFHFNLDERTLNSNKPQELLLSFCEDNGIPCLDVLPAFKTIQDRALYRENDGHLNDEGDLVVSELVRDFLFEETILAD